MDALINFFISSAHADSVTTPAQSGGLSFVMMIVIFFLFLYFGIWRPQNKRAKEQQNLLSTLAKGDEVLTAGGFLGRIVKINEQYLVVTVANNVDVVLLKSSITNVLPKGTLKALE